MTVTITTETKVREQQPFDPMITKGEAYDYTASDGRKFWASEAWVFHGGQEILVFEYVDGEIDYGEVAGGRNITFDEAKDDLVTYLNKQKEE